ncbi:hypothetical protein B2J73_17920 [Stutzerimonas stutzeri]|nr:hypothetical protein B2J73_17920 [Stutzerimonas stutzeri]
MPDGSNPSAAIVQSASDVQCSRLLKTTTALSRRTGAGFQGVRIGYTLTGCQERPRRTVRIESTFIFFDTCLPRSQISA